ncbi:hypothetical protein EMIT0232MI5_40376 [Pseudomonas sp. IT-232MI5]
MRRSIPATRQLAYARGFPSGGACPKLPEPPQYLVGVSLLAIAVCQPAIMLDVPAIREQARTHRVRC